MSRTAIFQNLGTRTSQLSVSKVSFGIAVGVLLVLLIPSQPAGYSVQISDDTDRAPSVTALTLQVEAPTEGLEVEATASGTSSSRSSVPGDAPCTLFVAPEGADENIGARIEQPLQTPAAAVSRAAPGDVVCFAPGTYPSPNRRRGALHIEDKQGSAGEPITFRSLDRSDPAVLTMGTVEAGRGVSVVFIQRSSFITIDGFEITEGFRGVTGNGVNNIRILNSKIHRTGGEVIAFGRRAGRQEPEVSTNPISSFVEISGNEISDSGLANGRPFGEGIYLGTSEPSYRDDSNSILLANNYIHDIVDEAIDVKTGVWGVTIMDNRIEDIEVKSQGAITISLQGENWEDGQFLISGNTISDVSSRNFEGVAIWLGHGNAAVENNVMWNIDDYGIYVPNTFNMADARDVVMTDNTIWNTGQESIVIGRDWDDVPSSPPIVRLDRTNRTWDGSHATTKIDACDNCVPNAIRPTAD